MTKVKINLFWKRSESLENYISTFCLRLIIDVTEEKEVNNFFLVYSPSLFISLQEKRDLSDP